MGASSTARSRVRAELTREIKDAARRHLAVAGAGQLSLRGVARELGMAPSALYRYFSSREELLIALLAEAQASLGAHAEQARDAVSASDLLGRWQAVCRAARRWAAAHPHEFALLYGPPVAGLRTPADTLAPASRVCSLLLELARDGCLTGRIAAPPADPWLSPRLRDDATRLGAAQDLHGLPPEVLTRAVTAWSQLIGAITLEIGHPYGAFQDNAAFFDHTVELMAAMVGFSPRGHGERDRRDS